MVAEIWGSTHSVTVTIFYHLVFSIMHNNDNSRPTIIKVTGNQTGANVVEIISPRQIKDAAVVASLLVIKYLRFIVSVCVILLRL